MTDRFSNFADLAECRVAMERMRDHAARIYLVETGRPFSPMRGSRVSSKTNASMIEARDYLAAQKAQRHGGSFFHR